MRSVNSFLPFFTVLYRVPSKLVVLWQRGAHRRRYSKSFNFQASIAHPYRGVMAWADPEELDMTCTLYKVNITIHVRKRLEVDLFEV